MACLKHPSPYLPSPLHIVNIARKRLYMPRYHIPTSRRQPCRDAKSCVSRAMNTFIICIFLSMKIGLTLRLTRKSAQIILETITQQPYHFSLVRRKILRLTSNELNFYQHIPVNIYCAYLLVRRKILRLYFLPTERQNTHQYPPHTALFQPCGARTRSFSVYLQHIICTRKKRSTNLYHT